MNQQPDKFFREKLEGFQKTAPSMAWEKIEAGLDKKNHKGLWLKIAAAVLFVAVGSFTLWLYRNPDATTEPQTAIKEEQKITTPAPKEREDQKTEEVLSDPEKIKPEQIAASKPKEKKTKAPVIIEENEVPLESVTIARAESTPQEVLPVVSNSTEASITPEEMIQTTDPVVAENATVSEEPITIIYSADEVNEKYLDKVALAKATSEQKKPSTFRKLLEKAYDLKNKQDPFGGLRQKKNEILALNFKNEKRSQTKQEHEQ